MYPVSERNFIMNQNLSSYRIFYTVANTGNISKAALHVHNNEIILFSGHKAEIL